MHLTFPVHHAFLLVLLVLAKIQGLAQVTSADAGHDITTCTTSAQLGANAPGVGETGSWQMLGGPGLITEPSSPDAMLLGAIPCENVLVWSITDGVNTTSDTVIVYVVDTTVAADAGPDMEIIVGCGIWELEGNQPPCQAPGHWSCNSNEVTITDPWSAHPQVSAGSSGTFTLQYTLTFPPECPMSYDQMTLTAFFADPQMADAGPDQIACLPDNMVWMQANAAIFPGVGSWALVSGAGYATDPSDPNTMVMGSGTGANVWVWTIVNGPCAVASDMMVITTDLCTGLATTGDPAPIAVWFDPDRERVRISGASRNAQVEVYDMQGRIWWSGTLNTDQADRDVVAFPPGLFVVRVDDHGIGFSNLVGVLR